MFPEQAAISPAWRDRLAVLGGVAACVVAAKAARLLWLRAQLSFGPVLVRQYKGQWALVTGGSEGLGKATAAALAKQGLHIILVSRSQQKLDAAAAEIQAQHPDVQVRTIAADVSKAEGCQKVLAQLKGTPVRVLVANAGGGADKIMPYWEYSAADEQQVQALNGTSCYSLVRGLLPHLIAAGGGAVVGISSIMSQLGSMAAPYGAEKAKINALMESLDAELKITGNHGVTAQSMVIGAVATPAIVKMMRPELRSASPAELSAAAASLQLPQAAPADAVGEAIVRAIGRVGPVVTPYWRHAVTTELFLGGLWPPSLQRCFNRRLTRRLMSMLDTTRATGATGGSAKPQSS